VGWKRARSQRVRNRLQVARYATNAPAPAARLRLQVKTSQPAVAVRYGYVAACRAARGGGSHRRLAAAKPPGFQHRIQRVLLAAARQPALGKPHWQGFAVEQHAAHAGVGGEAEAVLQEERRSRTHCCATLALLGTRVRVHEQRYTPS
jgi:hypothetical protein